MKLHFGFCFTLLCSVIIMTGCGETQQNNSDDEPVTIAQVQTTHISYKSLADTLTVNGLVKEGQQFTVRAPVTGYITKLYVHPGELIRSGQRMFSIRTREQAALAQDTSGTSLPRPSAVVVKAPVDGQISSITTGEGVYATEGSSMATLNSRNNLYTVVYVPAQWSRKVQPGDSALIQWADGRNKWIKLGNRLDRADSVSQSVLFIVNQIPSGHLLPGERLTVRIPVDKIVNEQVLPRNAVLTDESMSSWWVMKMINDSIAVRVPVTPGIVSGNWIAVHKPHFTKSDRILVEGNYGLPDTARVKVMSKQ